MDIQYIIQCKDGRTKQTGCFGYKKQITMFNGEKRFYSTTPVFSCLPDLFTYCKSKNITLNQGA